MKAVYTHPFPIAREEDSGASVLEGVSYVFLEYNWRAMLSSWNFPRVLSPYWRLLHSRTPGGAVTTASQCMALTSENLVLIPSDVETALSASGSIEMFWAHFLVLLPVAFRIRFDLSAPIEVSLAGAQRALIGQIIEGREQGAGLPADLLLYRALLDTCFADLLGPVPVDEPGIESGMKRIASVLAHIESNVGCKLDNAALGAVVGVGKDRLMKLFREVTGRSPQVFVTEARLKAASRALVETDESVKQIAVECGFSNRYYFTRVFVKRMGMGPAAYRRRFHAAWEEAPRSPS